MNFDLTQSKKHVLFIVEKYGGGFFSVFFVDSFSNQVIAFGLGRITLILIYCNVSCCGDGRAGTLLPTRLKTVRFLKLQ